MYIQLIFFLNWTLQGFKLSLPLHCIKSYHILSDNKICVLSSVKKCAVPENIHVPFPRKVNRNSNGVGKGSN